MGGGRRGNQNYARPIAKSSGSAQIPQTPEKPIDTANKLIKDILFNYMTGEYDKDLIDKLRDLLKNYDPDSPEMPLIRVVFTPTGLEGEKEADHLAAYIESFSVYLVGIGIKNVVWEFGEYPKLTESKDPDPEKQSRSTRRLMKKMNNDFSKATKSKKKKSNVLEEKVRKLKGSHLLGFDEGYGSGLDSPGNVKCGYHILKRVIKEIYDGFHTPKLGTTNEICFTWRNHLTVIAVMVCEAARFYPISSYILKLMEDKADKSLLEWMCHIINQWDSMSKIHLGDKHHVPYGEDIPNEFDTLTNEMVTKLCQDKGWVIRVLAVLCRSKNDEEGETSNNAN